MLKRLKYQVKFASTLKTLKGDIAFDTGLSGISGPNEAGKSMVLELIRFALFGSPALRAPLREYTEIVVALDFTVKGDHWKVKRTKNNAGLFTWRSESAVEVATGVTPVNKKIESIFGYGMKVFDIAHFCGQDDVNALTMMPAPDRKKMVDQTIGMDALDKATATAAGNRTTLAAQLKGLKMAVGEAPVPPVKPLDYEPSGQLGAEIQDLQPALAQFLLDRAWLAEPEPAPPVPPINPGLPSSAKIRQHVAGRAKLLEHVEYLRKTIGGTPKSSFSAKELDKLQEQLDRCCAWMDQCTFVDKWGEFPWWIKPETLKRVARNIDLRRDIIDYHATVKRLELQKISCDKCGNEIFLDGLGLDSAQRRYQELIDEQWALNSPDPIPDIKDREANAILASHNAWAQRRAKIADVPWVPMVPGGQAWIDAQRRALALAPLYAELEAIVIPQDHSEDLRTALHYEDRLVLYEEAVERQWKYTVERAARRRSFEKLKEIEGLIQSLQVAKGRALDYEMQVAYYNKAQAKYEENVDQVTELTAEVDEWQKAGDAIKTLRTKVKTFLVPSLNMAASQLLSLMTGGLRSSVVITEDFESIKVDGQPVETLSGSAKAVTNLAIRLGLGRVLTNSVFSVFLGDEIDASMDKDRAGFTAECFKSLGGVIGQIVLVSHKDLEVQHRITIC